MVIDRLIAKKILIIKLKFKIKINNKRLQSLYTSNLSIKRKKEKSETPPPPPFSSQKTKPATITPNHLTNRL